MVERSQRALTLTELLFALVLLGILGSLALPGMAAWLDGNRERSVLHELSASIQLGRTHAVAYQRPVTLCPSTDGRHCGSEWGEGWLLAEDGGERLLVGRALAKKERLRWNRSNRLRFLPSGQLNIHNGRFLLCGRHTVAWQLILNRQGRLRTASARENREKRELCSTSG
ncbi:GspH/FimT family pseudopilin [Pseudomonas aeruginosa]|uniref:GspH/FimT family pseudopilin n=1 Tax=Pseudomonas aeruginosa TaxID=287 RepID=UPI00376EF6A6